MHAESKHIISSKWRRMWSIIKSWHDKVIDILLNPRTASPIHFSDPALTITAPVDAQAICSYSDDYRLDTVFLKNFFFFFSTNIENKLFVDIEKWAEQKFKYCTWMGWRVYHVMHDLLPGFSTLKSEQNGWHFCRQNFKMHFYSLRITIFCLKFH